MTSTTSQPTSSISSTCSNIISSVLENILPTVSAETSKAEEEKEEEEEEEEPEDPAPAIREECTETKCAKYKHHFDHCQEKVNEGKGAEGEDCVEELFHLMHCVDGCAVPKVFSKLV
ncbi:ubiquinol-cytochrome C reductase hinge domain-containing protein [Melampsora americana]|nr:ubiquinol-cytochrome C reductase hinge domain-containing protein [Melampsora americana]